MKPNWHKIGVTLTELLIVVVIIAILAVLALPMLVKTLEKAKVGEAMSNLNLIRTGQKIYFLEHGCFAGTGYAQNPMDALNVENPNNSTNRYFYYEVTSAYGNSGDFTAQAVRGGTGALPASAPFQGDTYVIQREGTITGTLGTGD